MCWMTASRWAPGVAASAALQVLATVLRDRSQLLVVELHRLHAQPRAAGRLDAPAPHSVRDQVAGDAEQPGDRRPPGGVILSALLQRAGERLGDDVKPNLRLTHPARHVGGYRPQMAVIEHAEIIRPLTSQQR